MKNVIENSDKLIKELLETESQMTSETLNLLKSRFANEKKQWSDIYQQKQSEIESLKTKLTEMEARFNDLRKEHSQDKLEEIEKIKIYIEEQKDVKLKDKLKWDSIENKLNSYKKMAGDTLARLSEEKKKVEKFQDEYTEEEKKLRDMLLEKDKGIVELRENLLKKEQDWFKEKTIYEEKVTNLTENLQNTKDTLDQEKTRYAKSITEKNEKQSKVQSILQEVTVELNRQTKNNQELKTDIKGLEKTILSLQQENKKNLDDIEIQRDEWKRAWQKEQEEWGKYKNTLLEKERILKTETESQIASLLSMLKSLETELSEERKTTEGLKARIQERDGQNASLKTELEGANNALEHEKQNFAMQSKAQEDFFLREKKQIIEQNEGTRQAREEYITKLQQDILELNNKYTEMERFYKLEKTEKNANISRNEELKEQNRILEKKLDEETQNFRETILQEQVKYEDKIRQINLFSDEIKKAREDENRQLNNKLSELTGEFNELRMIYNDVKLSNEQFKIRNLELENELKKLKEVERNKKSGNDKL